MKGPQRRQRGTRRPRRTGTPPYASSLAIGDPRLSTGVGRYARAAVNWPRSRAPTDPGPRARHHSPTFMSNARAQNVLCVIGIRGACVVVAAG